MPGVIKNLLDKIIRERSRGNSTLVVTTKTKLLLKGLDPQQFSSDSEDDPIVIDRVRKVAKELGVLL